MGQKLNTKSFKDLAIVAEITKGQTMRVISGDLEINRKRIDRVINQHQELLQEEFTKVQQVISQDLTNLTRLCIENLQIVLSTDAYRSNRDRIMAVNACIRLFEVTGVAIQPE